MTGGSAAPWLRPPQFHYRLGVRMRQHVRDSSGGAQGSPDPLVFWPWVVTPGLTQSREYKQRKRYSFVMHLLQICANVKSALRRPSRRDGGCKCPGMPNNQFPFNTLQGHGFRILQRVKRKARANVHEGTAVSTTFSTEDRVSELREKRPPEEPQVRKNTGFPRFYSAVST